VYNTEIKGRSYGRDTSESDSQSQIHEVSNLQDRKNAENTAVASQMSMYRVLVMTLILDFSTREAAHELLLSKGDSDHLNIPRLDLCVREHKSDFTSTFTVCSKTRHTPSIP
jgi:hypothetical protein